VSMSLRAAAVLAVLALPVPALCAAPLRTLVELEAKGADDSAEYRESLEAALCAAYPGLVALRREAGSEPLAAESARRDCGLALSVNVAEAGDLQSVSWSYTSNLTEEALLASGAFEKPRPGASDLAASFWTEIAEALPKIAAALPERLITVAGRPGTRVEGLGDPFVLPPEGLAEIRLALPASLRWRSSAVAAVDQEGQNLFRPGDRLELPYEPLPRWRLDLGLYGLSYLELRAGLFRGRRSYASLSIAELFAGVSLRDYSGPPPKPPLAAIGSSIQLGLGGGWYFMPPESRLRAYAELAASLRMDFEASGLGLGDATAMGISPSLGAEWGLSRKGKIYLEIGALVRPLALGESELPLARLGWRSFL